MTAPEGVVVSKGEILVVEDTPSSLKLLSDLLTQAGYVVRQAPNGELALWTVEASLPDLILLDINMPDINGFEVCRRLKLNPATSDVPVVFISALFDVDNIVTGLKLGAVDYVAKPYVAEEILARVQAHVELSRVRRELQSERQHLERRVQLRTAELEAKTHDLQEEIQIRRVVEEQLRLAGKVFSASFDSILVLSLDHTILLVNPAFSRLTGYADAEAKGQSLAIIASDKNEAGFLERLWQDVDRQGCWSGEIWLQHKDHNVFPAAVTFAAVKDEMGRQINVIAFCRSIAESKDAETLINFLTRHDPLTGLPNRAQVASHFERLCAQSGDDEDQVVVLCVDLDRFKFVNELLGHAVGDRVLQMVSGLLSDCLMAEDIAYRQGADEFVIICGDFPGLWRTRDLTQRLLSRLNAELDIDEGNVSISASIGIASAARKTAVLGELVRNAGTALSRAKQEGGNTFAFFAEEMDAEARSSFELERKLRNALALNQFEVFYQPQLDLQSGEMMGAEALLRWKDSQQGYISPALFIPVAEKTGQIVAIGEWVMNEVCRQIKEWRRQGLRSPKVAVNVSARQFQHEDLCQLVLRALAAHGVPADCLEIEITEGAVVHDVTRAIATLRRLKAIGVRISVDDFGTGYSSLSYLKRFPIDVLKIDQSFIRDMLRDEASGAIVRSIIALAHNLHLQVIAEGVETAEELAFLRSNGCDEMQGYFFSKPLPVAAFVELLVTGKKLAFDERGRNE